MIHKQYSIGEGTPGSAWAWEESLLVMGKGGGLWPGLVRFLVDANTLLGRHTLGVAIVGAP